MSHLEAVGKVITADVLVVGHGIAGLATAISVKEENPELHVITVDKGFPGYAGKANKGGGHVAFIPEGAEEQYVEYHTRNLGDYLNDQDMLRIYANNTVKTLDRWASWGVKFLHRETTQNAHPIIPWRICLVDLDIMVHMARHARKLGIESFSKVAVTDLLTSGDRIGGAMGMSLLTGETQIYRAKSVILACGDQNWSIMPMWASGKGDGIAAAYRAGARMRNAEFGSFVNMVTASSKTVAYGAENVLFNAQGEACTTRADLDESLKSVVGGVDLGGAQAVLMYLDVQDGKGPIYEDVSKNDFIGSFIGRNMCCYGGDADPPFHRPLAQKFWNKLYFKNRLGSFTEESHLREVIPGVVGECSPLYADHTMATSIPGLFAAGDICANGSAWAGAVPTPPGRNRGSGLVHAVLTSMIAGKSAAEYAAGVVHGELSEEESIHCKAAMLAPLNSGGDLTPQAYMRQIQAIMQPVAYTGYKHEARLREALGKVMALKADLGRIQAVDPHSINAANECRSTILCAEMFFRASLERKESRGWHLREDYKERDDAQYLKWIEIRDQGGEMHLEMTPLPMENYRYQPEQ